MKNKLVTNQEMKDILKNESLDVRHRVYYVDEDRHKTSMKPKKSKYTLNQLGETVDKLVETVDKGFKQVNARLDYIVKANNLKDLANSK